VIARLRKSELALHGALVLGGVVIASLFNYLFYMLIGRRAGVETYGIVTSLLSALLVVSAPATVVQLIAARLAADLEARGDNAALRRLSDVVTLWTAVAAACVLVPAIVFRQALASYFNITSNTPIVVAACAAAVVAVVIAQRGVLQGSHKFGDYSASMSIDAVGKVAVGVPLVSVLGASGAIFGVVTSLVLACAYSLYAFRIRFGRVRAPLSLDRKLISRVVSHVGLAQLTMTVLMFYDVPLIKHAFDARSAGLYAAAALVGRAVLAATSFVPTLIMPKATARAAAGRSPFKLLLVAVGLSLAAACIAAAASWLAPKAIVTLLAGSAFGEAAPLVFPYVLASGLLSIAYVIVAYKIGLHRYDFVVPAAVVATAEITIFSLWHPTLTAAITVLLCGHLGILCTTLLRLNAPAKVIEAQPVTLSTS
jgi:O-antigen/teichoic acid export membrane protein